MGRLVYVLTNSAGGVGREAQDALAARGDDADRHGLGRDEHADVRVGHDDHERSGGRRSDRDRAVERRDREVGNHFITGQRRRAGVGHRDGGDEQREKGESGPHLSSLWPLRHGPLGWVLVLWE